MSFEATTILKLLLKLGMRTKNRNKETRRRGTKDIALPETLEIRKSLRMTALAAL